MKNVLTRTKYLGYYFKKMDWPRFRKFLRYAKKETGWSTFRLYRDSISCVYRYNIGWIDYFIFRFFEKGPSEREKWMGTGFKYESDLLMNSKSTRHLLENKIHFYEAYGDFVLHAVCTLDDLQSNNDRASKVLSNATGKIVIKDALGQCGWDVEIVNAGDYTPEELIQHMKSRGFNLAEEYIVQHPELARLSDTGVNTIRIISQLNKDNEVEILGARLRISVNSHVDNLASGNIAAAVDLDTGIVNGPGVYSDITKSDVSVHPVSGITLAGFQIPMWEECIDMVKRAALQRPENRSIGWDVVLTGKGPELLEGNHNWCKILWQLPINQGLKSVLEKHLEELPTH